MKIRFLIFGFVALFVSFVAFEIEFGQSNAFAEPCPVDNKPIYKFGPSNFNLGGNVITTSKFKDAQWGPADERSPEFLQELKVENVNMTSVQIDDRIDKIVVIDFVERLGIDPDLTANPVGIIFYADSNDAKMLKSESIVGFSYIFNTDDRKSTYHHYYQRNEDGFFKLSSKYSMKMNGDPDVETIVALHVYAVSNKVANSRLYLIYFPEASIFESQIDKNLIDTINIETDFFKDVELINSSLNTRKTKRSVFYTKFCGNAPQWGCPAGPGTCNIWRLVLNEAVVRMDYAIGEEGAQLIIFWGYPF